MTHPAEGYMEPKRFERIKAFAAAKETPCLLIDTHIVRERLEQLKTAFSYADIFYAFKANPEPDIARIVLESGGAFDIASVYELEQVLALGAAGERISYGNTIKKSRDIRRFYQAGVRLFATDSEGDLRNIAKAAPGSQVYVRILTEGNQTADWPLSRKFGCQPDMATDLLVMCRDLGLEPYGISFHVGSQQRDIGAWDAAIAKVKEIFRRASEEGIELKMVNMGGGLPANYLTRTNDLETYAREITRFLESAFGDRMPRIIIEPGRSLVADAGVIATEVVLIARKSRTALSRWIFTDVGKFSGLIETTDEAIKYPIISDKEGELEEAILAGPTCDSADILYEKFKYPLPLNLAAGDRLYILSAGAYTASYSAAGFNGFPPLPVYCL